MVNAQLKTFLCVADNGSFSKAAEKLYLSTTAVIKQMNTLEKHLELQLLNRTNHGVTLTPAGNVIYKHAKFMIDYADQALAEARALDQAEKKVFRVGTSLLNPCKPFMDLWYPISRNFPGCQLQIIPFDDDHDSILDTIQQMGEKFDFIIGVNDSKLWNERANFMELRKMNHCIAVPVDHRLARRKSLTLDDLEGETLIMVSHGDSPVVDSLRSEIQKHPGITIEDAGYFYDINTFNRCVQNHCAMVSLPCWADVHPGLVNIPMKWDHKLSFGILYPKNPSKDVLKVIEQLHKNAQEA